MKQQGVKAESVGLGSRTKANGVQLGNRSTRRSKRKESEQQCIVPQVTPQNQFQQPMTKQSFEGETTRFILQIPQAQFTQDHFKIKEITRVQRMPLEILVNWEVDCVVCSMKLPDEQSISSGEEFGITLHGKYSFFNGFTVVNNHIKSMSRAVRKSGWQEIYRIKLTLPIYSDFFLVFTLRNEENLFLGFPGLVNQGNTCYLNSYLQMFFHLPEFRRLIFLAEAKQTDKFPATLQMLFYKMSVQESAVSPEDLIRSFGWSKKDTQVQQDVQEFSCLFFEILEKKVMVNRPPEKIQSIPELFCGELTNYIQCINVDFRAENLQRFYDLSIPMAPTLNEALNLFFSETLLDEKNRYQTEYYGLQQARKGLRISKMPPVLMLQLKRFQYNYMTEANQKILQECKYPEQIDFAQWTLEPSASLPYVLYAVLVHEGPSAYAGHYYVLIKSQGEWFRFNDQRVQKVSKERALQYNYGGESTTVEYDYRQMRVQVKSSTLNATAYMLVYVKKDLYPQLFSNAQSQPPQSLIDQTKYIQEIQVEKKLRRQFICDIPLLRWDFNLKGKEVQSFGIFPKDKDEITQTINAAKNQKAQDWLAQLASQAVVSEDRYVYILWSVQERDVLINVNCRSNQMVKQLFNEIQNPSILLAPIAITKQEYLVVIKLFNSAQENNFTYYGVNKFQKESTFKDLYVMVASMFPGEKFNQYYLEDRKSGLTKIEATDGKLIPQASPTKNQLLVVVVEQIKKGEEGGEAQKWYQTEMNNLSITFKNQLDRQFTWDREVDQNTTLKKIRQIIFEEILNNNEEYQSAHNIVVKYKEKKNSKVLTQAKDKDKLKEITKFDRTLFFSYSSLKVNDRLTQKQLTFYLRQTGSKRLSEPQTIVIDKSKPINLAQMITESSTVKSNLPAKANHSYRMFLLAKDRSYVNDIVDANGHVPGKGELLTILQKEKNTALVVEQYPIIQSMKEPVNILVHHVTKTGERFGSPFCLIFCEQTLLSTLKIQILELIRETPIDFEGKVYQTNPMKVRLLAYTKEWAKAEDLPEPTDAMGETDTPDETIVAKFGHPRYLRIGIVHNSISKSVQKLNLNVQ